MTGLPCSSGFLPPSAPRWKGWLGEAPSLVAEALERVRDPLAAWLTPGPPAPPVQVAARLAGALLPATASDPPPSWLRSDQRLSFARALAGARRHRGVLLADPPGTGKSWIGLAVAGALDPGRPVHVIAPATLRSQWLGVAERTGASIAFHSSELLSRGRAPDPARGPVVLDESHRLRNPLTRRYLTLAPWCVGRRGILLSATPVVNRLEDVIHQLLLLVRDDVLAWAGIPSLRRFDPGHPPGELGRLVVTGEDRSDRLPTRQSRAIRVDDSEDRSFTALQQGIGSLLLSRDAGTARLIRVSLLAALASSPQAIADALARYRSLLLHARDAAEAGHALPRQAIRQFVGGELDQLVLWPMVAEGSTAPELALADLELLPGLEALARSVSAGPDAKCRVLIELLRARKRTLVFTSARATVQYLRRQLGSGVAWCTGDRSGIDAMPIPREDALDLLRKPFRSEDWEVSRPRTLVTTDIAAEGLDLPLTARVIHYDLPWTAVRLDQRSGRAFRLGSTQEEVEVIRFLPPVSLETALQREAILLRKAELPSQLGLGDDSAAAWKVRARIAGEWEDVAATTGLAILTADSPSFVAGLRFDLTDGSSEEIVLAWSRSGWLRDEVSIAEVLRLAWTAPPGRIDHPPFTRAAIRRIAIAIRRRLRAARSGRLAIPALDPAGAVLRRRLLDRARVASRRRDFETLGVCEQGLRWLRRGLCAGEDLLVRSWKDAPVGDLIQSISRLGEDRSPPDITQVELTALLLFVPPGDPR